jgi:hypothetical protein
VDVGEDMDTDNTNAAKTSSKSSATKSSKSSSGGKDSGTPTGSQTSPAGGFSATPSLDARAKFGANLFLMSGSELGHVMTTLELECPRVLESWEEQKVEINVDEIPPKVFSTLQSYVSSKVGTRSVPDSPEVDDVSSSNKSRKKRKSGN